MADKSILITGAASGIGRATALRFAAGGWQVGAFDLPNSGIEALAQEHDSITVGVMDVTDDESVRAGVASFAESAGRLDAVLNNAGILSIGQFAEIAADRHAAIVDVNVTGVMRVAHAAHPYLAKTPGARLINLASASADFGVPEFASYSASKFAVRGLTEALNLEWAAADIHVCAIWPSFVSSPMLDDVGETTSMQRLGISLTPDSVAKVAWRAATGRRRLHLPVGLLYKLLFVSGQWLPFAMKRLSMRLITGY
ncbi:MAG: SDR family oxidoreductase [Salinisphaeraceae bacterium]